MLRHKLGIAFSLAKTPNNTFCDQKMPECCRSYHGERSTWPPISFPQFSFLAKENWAGVTGDSAPWWKYAIINSL